MFDFSVDVAPDDLAGVDEREMIDVFQHLERQRRRLEVAFASVVGEVERRGLYREDGHATVEGWCRALGRWSPGEARHVHRTSQLLHALPTVHAAAIEGGIGVAQLREMARAHANPRCGDQFTDVAHIFVDVAGKLSYQDFRLATIRWEMLADADGAHRDQEQTHARRRASITEQDGVITVSATGCGIQGAAMMEIFRRFCDAEFITDWEEAKVVHGDDTTPNDLGRTDAQRRFDALFAIFEDAASTPPDAQPPEPVVNLCTDIATFEAAVRATSPDTDATTCAPPSTSADWHYDAPPFNPRRRYCETLDGIPVTRADLVVAALIGRVRRVVFDSAGVVIDMGRRTRLLKGRKRDAVFLADSRCIWPGCLQPFGRSQIDHTTRWADGGTTSTANSGPLCLRHNLFKNRGFRVMRDAEGYWHTYRPDGTEVV